MRIGKGGVDARVVGEQLGVPERVSKLSSSGCQGFTSPAEAWERRKNGLLSVQPRGCIRPVTTWSFIVKPRG